MTDKTSSHKINIATIIIVGSLLGSCYGALADTVDKINSAKNYYQANDLASAIIELKNALQIDPNSVEARLLLGKAYLR
jgi:Flp pilus assembly protein TadD